MKTILRSDELNCPSCVARIEKAVKALPGVDDVTVHFTTGRIEVDHRPDGADPQRLQQAVRDAGYESFVSPF